MRLGAPSLLATSRPCSLGQLRGPRAAPLVCRAATVRDDGFLTPIEPGRAAPGGHEVQAQQQQQQQQQQQTDGPPPRRRGRPPGIPAWNKGVPMAESTRRQLSLKLKQKWKDPEYRRSVTEAMVGRSSWNAGRPHDDDTRAKMADAKVGKPKPLATRKRMAAAALGHPVSPEVRAEVGERFRGQPKSAEHRSKLAAVARRRHAATRVLRAVEAVYAAASTAPAAPSAGAANGGRGPVAAAALGSGAAGASGGAASAPGAAGSPPAGSSAGLGAVAPAGAAVGSTSSGAGAGAGPPNLGAVRAAAYSMGLTGLSDSKTGKRLNRAQILNTFKAELREYRALQEELSTWTAAFREKNNRKPNLVDVQRTGIPWLIERFKQYVVLHDRLFSDTSVLRSKLSEALPDPEAIRSAHSGGNNSGLAAPNSVGSLGPTNANGPGAGARSAMASRFAAVMEYKMQRQGQAAAGAAEHQQRQQQQQQALQARSGADEGLDEVPSAVDQLASKVMASQAPPRVRLAMQAAMEYRQKKAAATKAAADAAAADARAASSSSAAVRAARLTSAGMLAGAPPPPGLSSIQPPAGVEPAAAAVAVAAAAEATPQAPAAPTPAVAPVATAVTETAAEAPPSGGVIAAAGALG